MLCPDVVFMVGQSGCCVVGYRQRMLNCEGVPYNMWHVLWLSPASWVLLLYPVAQDLWLGSCYIGKAAGNEYLHVIVKGSGAVESP